MQTSLRRFATRALIALVSGSASAGVFASFAECGPPASTAPFIGVAPAQPLSTEASTITVLDPGLVVTAIQSVVRASSIDVNLYGYPANVVEPESGCQVVGIAPLPAGSYTVNLYNRGLLPGAGGGVTLRKTESLVVKADPTTSLAARAYFLQSFVGVGVLDLATDAAKPLADIPVIPGQETAFTGVIAASPDGRLVYVFAETPPIVDFRLTGRAAYVFDTATGAHVRTVPLAAGASKFVVSADGTKLFVVVGNTLVAVSAVDGSVLATAVVGARPFTNNVTHIDLSPGGGTLYAGFATGIALVDTTTFTVRAAVPLTFAPAGLVVTRDGTTAYVTSNQGAQAPGAVVAISTKEQRVTWTLAVDAAPGELTARPDGRYLYVTLPNATSVRVVDTETRLLVPTLLPLAMPQAPGIAVSPAGDKVIVASLGGSATVVDTSVNLVSNYIGPYFRAFGTAFVAPRVTLGPRAIEYYHAEFDHYFITSDGAEIERLDAGQIGGWLRTGESFAVGMTQTVNHVPVCRFFSAAFAPKSSHFYAPRSLGCEPVLSNEAWQYEGDVFFVALPDATGKCTAGYEPVWRFYNNGIGGAPNHRFTTSTTVRNSMLERGWTPEGAGEGVGMCALSV